VPRAARYALPVDPSNTETPTLLVADPLIGTTIAGRYHLLEVLGEGGAGRVYLARQEPMGRAVALKMMRLDVSAEARREFSSRFAREAALLGQLSHPNVVTVHDYGTTEGGDQYVVMERLRGRSLKDAVRDEPVEAKRAVRIAEGIARGLAHAHEHGLVHRDVKPSNVFLVEDDGGRERPVLLDFGLVKHKDAADDVTRTGTYMGTPAYTAPEQAKGAPDVDGKADVYALGVLLYRMLSGVLPYKGEHSMAVVLAHITEPYPPIAANSGVHVDPAVEGMVRAAMEKDPRNRPSASDIARSLEEWRISQTAGATATPAPQRAASKGWVLPLLGGIGALGAVGLGGLVILGVALAGGAWLTLSRGSAPPAAAPIVVAQAPPPVAPAPEPVVAPPPPVVPEPAPPPKPAPVPAKPRTEKPPVAKPPVEKPPPEPVPETHVDRPPPAEKPPPPPAATPGHVLVDNVEMDQETAKRALAWVNAASEDDLVKAGVYDRGVETILASRPFASMTAFGDTRMIGEATVRAVVEASGS
jgi:predicted Ser/Thr protein kinase